MPHQRLDAAVTGKDRQRLPAGGDERFQVSSVRCVGVMPVVIPHYRLGRADRVKHRLMQLAEVGRIETFSAIAQVVQVVADRLESHDESHEGLTIWRIGSKRNTAIGGQRSRLSNPGPCCEETAPLTVKPLVGEAGYRLVAQCRIGDVQRPPTPNRKFPVDDGKDRGQVAAGEHERTNSKEIQSRHPAPPFLGYSSRLSPRHSGREPSQTVRAAAMQPLLRICSPTILRRRLSPMRSEHALKPIALTKLRQHLFKLLRRGVPIALGDRLLPKSGDLRLKRGLVALKDQPGYQFVVLDDGPDRRRPV